MSTAVKLTAFIGGLAVAFAAAAGLGYAAGPDAERIDAVDEHGSDHDMTTTSNTAATGAEDPPGLAMSRDGYSLQLADGIVPAAPDASISFTIRDEDGRPVTGYETTHDKDLHLIAVRRDTAGFQHVHPSLDADGTWSVPLDLSLAGEWRVFADFAPAGHDALTLGADLSVAGEYDPLPLPEPRTTASVDGYDVTLDGGLVPGTSSKLTLTVSRDGRPVTDLEPYLAAYGHLVALRDGDLAYLHVHPDGEPGDGRTEPGPDITFYATTPTAGSYRLFLDFKHNGRVRTAAFTVEAGTARPGHATGPQGGSAHDHEEE